MIEKAGGRHAGSPGGALARRLACFTAEDRRDLMWLAVGGLLMGFFTGFQAGGDSAGLTVGNVAMILATLGGMGIVVRHWLRITARQDEMYRAIEAAGLRWAAIAILALAVLSGLLELHLGAPVVPIWIALPVFLLALVLGTVVAARRLGA